MHLACLKRVGEFLKDIEARRIPLAEYRIDRLYGRRALRQQLRFARDLRANRTQIVHTYGFYPNSLPSPRRGWRAHRWSWRPFATPACI